MTELRPLLESTDDDWQRALLQSMRSELPSSAGMRDSALALGLAGSTAESLAASLTAASSLSHAGVPVAVASTTATPATATSSATAAGGSANALGATSLSIVGKSLLGGALASFLALTALDHSRSTSASTSTPMPRTQSAVQAADVAVASQPLTAAAAETVVAASPVSPAADPHSELALRPSSDSAAGRSSPLRLEPDKSGSPSVNAPSNATFELPPRPEPSSAVPANASLAAEIRVLDEARAALAVGNSPQASALLDRYAANRPSPVLGQEAALLRVRVLLNQGDRAGAAQRARRIIREYPESAHVDWLRILAAEP